MTKKIFRSFLIASLVVLLLSLLTVTAVLYNYFGSVQSEELRDELRLAADAVESLGKEYLAMQDSDRYRLTWVDNTGDVLFDTHEQASVMENHADREEIREALTGGTGSSLRYSSTLIEKTIYEAMKLTDYLDAVESLDKRALFVGDGAATFEAIICERMGDGACFAPAHLSSIRAGAAAAIALHNAAQAGDYLALEPLYLRAPQAERERAAREAKANG